MDKKERTENIIPVSVEKNKEMPINEVDGIVEGVLYFLKNILLKHFIKIIITAFVFALVYTGYSCKTKWFEFNKESMRTKAASKQIQ